MTSDRTDGASRRRGDPRGLIAPLLAPAEPGRVARASFALAAVAVAVGGVLHGRLYHQGYEHVHLVGPLFFLNVIGSAAVVLLLLARRYALFAGGAVSISAGAVVSILFSHRSNFFGFSESGYSSSAQAIIAAELAALVLTLVGLAAARAGLFARPAGATA